MSSRIKTIILIAVIAVILLVPLPADDEFLRFHIREGACEGYGLYYATREKPVPGDDTFIRGEYDEKTGDVVFDIDGSLEGDITVLRLDFPADSELVLIDSVSVRSAGITRKRWSVTDLFEDGDLALINDAGVHIIASKETSYISSKGVDPFVVFNEETTKELTGCFSHKIITKICIATLILLGVFFYRKDERSESK